MAVFPPFPDSPDTRDPRYAIYFLPEPGSPLALFGARWLGRDCATGKALAQPSVTGLAPETLAEITESARNYGFHATLKAPFHLKPGHSVDDLRDAMRSRAASLAAFEVGLALRDLGGFLALMMAPSNHRMTELAAVCVREFEPFRAALSDRDLERRRKANLSSQQDTLLQRWGYPYVMEEFRFHMTLSKRLPDGPDRAAVIAALEPLTADVTARPAPIDAISLVRQDTRDAPFVLVERFPFGA